MVDRLTPSQRSRLMSRVRGTNTRLELLLRRALWNERLRFRVKNRLPGRPDVVFSRYGLAIFVDSCFWHACPVHGTMPKTNAAFWRKKLAENKERDFRVAKELHIMGWSVIRFWEHDLKRSIRKCIYRIEKAIERAR